MLSKRVRKECSHYQTAAWDSVSCQLCPHLCSIAPSRPGACGVRVNRNGILVLDSYGRVAKRQIISSTQIPFFHYHPRTKWMQVGMKGCTMRCPFCNTAKISLVGSVTTEPLTPDALVFEAGKEEANGIVFGINEPVPAHEYILDVFKAAKNRGLMTAVETNGTWMEEPFQEIIAVTDAFLFGLKGFSEAVYSAELGGQLDFILHNLETAFAQHKHVEISYVVLGNEEQAVEDAHALLQWLKVKKPTVPILVRRQMKDYISVNETSLETANHVVNILKTELPYVYNMDSEGDDLSTLCRHCGEVLIRRNNHDALLAFGTECVCPNCAKPVEMIL